MLVVFLIQILLLQKFQFPSNGKEHGKKRPHSAQSGDGERVSIPFKREGAWKAPLRSETAKVSVYVSIPFKREGAWKEKTTQRTKRRRRTSFNSLQTGRSMESAIAVRNGEGIGICFNSLQTGRSMERCGYDGPVRRSQEQSFNSLQTGRSMESNAQKTRWGWDFSFNSLQTGRSMERKNYAELDLVD